MTWHIIERNVLKEQRYFVRVRCDCGYIGLRREDHVISGRTNSCKSCTATKRLKQHPNAFFAKRPHLGVGGLTRTVWFSIIQGAKKRGIEFNITIEYAASLFNGRCALSGVPINMSSALKNCGPDYSKFTASFDRKESKLGYLEGNMQWVHKAINRMKGNLTDAEFVKWCRIVVSYHDEVAKCDLTRGGSCGS